MMRIQNMLVLVILLWASPALADGDAAETAADAPPPTEGPEDREAAHDDILGSHAQLVIEATLAKGVSFIPAPKRVVNTAYVFRVDEVLKGAAEEDYVAIYDTGGVLRDGRMMDTVESFKLRDGGKYVVYAHRVDGEYWLDNVLQVDPADRTVADASGRAVVGLDQGQMLVQQQQTKQSLRYTQPIEPAPAPMDEPPSGSLPVPETQHDAAAAFDAAEPLQLDQIKSAIKQAAAEPGDRQSIEPTADRDDVGDAADRSPAGAAEDAAEDPRRTDAATGSPGEASPRDPGLVEFQLSGQHVTSFQSHYHFLPDDDNWAWTAHSRGAWNRLVEPTNGLQLFAYKIDSDGNPIRNRLPVADDDRHNAGVLTDAQMTAGGYDTWTSLGANGVCYRWWDPGNRVTETDVLINPAIANDEVQFRKSLTHEYGHALTLGHERHFFALMYPGTFRQPHNYASLWYTRRDDHRGVRAMLEWVNRNVAGGAWTISQFADVATWSQSHPAPGTDGELVMTTISDRTLDRGETATIRNLHIENRGTQPAPNTVLRFYLSTDETISSSDREIASYTWRSLDTYWIGDLNVRIPAGTPASQYYVGWTLTTDATEPSTSNNIALLLHDRNSGFRSVTVRVP